MFFLIVFGIGAFLLMGSYDRQGAQKGDKIPGTTQQQGHENDRRLTMEDLFEDRENTNLDGWNLEDVDINGRKSAAERKLPENKSTEKNGWSLGEVDTAPQKPANSGFKFSNLKDKQD